MAGSATDLIIRLLVDDKDLDKVDKSKQTFDNWGTGLDIASRGAAVTLTALGAVSVVTGTAAANAEQAIGAVDSVFGEYAGKVHDYAGQAADAVSLSETQYSNMASIMGSQFKNMGVPMDEVAGKTNDMIGLGADLAATFGGETSEAVDALSSLFRGETDPIERYGVSIKEADINARLAAMGMEGLEGEAAKTARTQAILSLLTEQTAAAQGQHARESDTASGAMGRMQAKMADAGAALGTSLLPLISQGSELLSGFAGWAEENAGTMQVLGFVIGGLAAVVIVANTAFRIYTAGQAIWTAVQAAQTGAQWANNAAWLASPVTWIILAIIVAIGLLVAAGIWLYNNWDSVTKFIGEAWANVSAWFITVGNNIVAWWNGMWSSIGSFVRNAWNNWIVAPIRNAWNWVTNAIRNGLTLISNAWNATWTGLGSIVRTIWNGVLGWIEGGVNKAIGLINGLITAANLVPGVNIALIPNVHLPRLATGGVTTGPMIAMIGDNPGGREYVEPVDEVAARLERVALAAAAGATARGGDSSRLHPDDIRALAAALASAIMPAIKTGSAGMIRAALGG